jgi:hypothetical protein
MPYVVPYINTILSFHSSAEKHTVFYEKYLIPLYLRAYTRKNLHVSKIYINFVSFFRFSDYYMIVVILKNDIKIQTNDNNLKTIKMLLLSTQKGLSSYKF